MLHRRGTNSLVGGNRDKILTMQPKSADIYAIKQAKSADDLVEPAYSYHNPTPYHDGDRLGVSVWKRHYLTQVRWENNSEFGRKAGSTTKRLELLHVYHILESVVNVIL